MVNDKQLGTEAVHRTKLAGEESGAMKNLEELLGKALKDYEDTNFHPLGFRTSGGHVTQLWLVGQQVSQLPVSLANLHSLQELVLKCNQLTQLPEWVCQLDKLEVLDLSHNRLEDLPRAINQLINLKELVLRNNQLLNIPESLGTMKSLERLSLSNNKICVLPKTFATLQSLKTLDLRNNYFTRFPEIIPNRHLGKNNWDNLNFGQFQGHDSHTGVGLAGEVAWDVFELPSFRDTPIQGLFRIVNTGNCPINEITFLLSFQAEFRPLDLDGIKCYFIRGDISGPLELVSQPTHIDLQRKENSSKKKSKKHAREVAQVVQIKFENLHENPVVSGFQNGDAICFTLTIQALKPNAEVVFRPGVSCQVIPAPGETPLEITYEGVEVPVAHIRRKFRKGKEIKNLSEGNYEISVFVENTSEFDLKYVNVIDKVPLNFRAKDFAPAEPLIVTLEDQDILTWNIPIIKPGQGWSQTYRISGEGVYTASEAQFPP